VVAVEALVVVLAGTLVAVGLALLRLPVCDHPCQRCALEAREREKPPPPPPPAVPHSCKDCGQWHDPGG
jgi:hypothetical protein